MQQATWLKGRNSMCIFAVGRALVPTQEEKTICALVERIYLVIVSREGNHARFELLSKIFESFNVMGCIPLQSVYGHAKKGVIYAWIMHRWIVQLSTTLLFSNGLSIIIRRLSLISNKNFLFSRAKMLKLSKEDK